MTHRDFAEKMRRRHDELRFDLWLAALFVGVVLAMMLGLLP